VKNVKSQVLKIIPLSLTHQKNFTQTNFDAIENFEKVTQVQWKKVLLSLFLKSSAPLPHVLHKNTKILYTQERKIKSKITNLMLTTVHPPLESFLNHTTAAICHQQLRNSGLESEFLYQTKNTIWPAIMLIIFLNYDNDQN